MQATIWIAVGSAIGGAARYWVLTLVTRIGGGSFPWGTLAVNVTGSMLIGVFAAVVAPQGGFVADSASRQFVTLGLLGGFTTFSAFSLQTLQLLHSGHLAGAGANIAVSVAACLLGVWVGHQLGLAIAR